MKESILGLHHITAIAAGAKRNLDFYTKVLGQRLVKKTVNFDDPKTYHFYFGTETGAPGTILTFFPWEGIIPGRTGVGMATDIGYAIPSGSIEFWVKRFQDFGVRQEPLREVFGERVLPFLDPDGLRLRLIEPTKEDKREGWETTGIDSSKAIRGFHSVVLTLRDIVPTAAILTEVLGYRLLTREGNVSRYVTDAVDTASIIDLLEQPDGTRGINAAGTNHHIAFRVQDEDVLMAYRARIEARGLSITPKINRDYFFSLYFREPGGVLFELATDNPGFATDEELSELGTGLRLPKQHEHLRPILETSLPKLED